MKPMVGNSHTGVTSILFSWDIFLHDEMFPFFPFPEGLPVAFAVSITHNYGVSLLLHNQQ